MTATELHFGTDEGLRPGVRASRFFEVDGYKAATALSDPGLPTQGSSHPDIASIYATVPEAVSRIGPDTWRVRVDYVAAPSGRGPDDKPPPDDQNINYRQRKFGTTTRELTIPFIFNVEVSVADSAGPSLTTMSRRIDRKVKIHHDVLDFKLHRSVITGADMATIRAQRGKIHTIDGLEWLFLGADAIEVEPANFEYVYHWIGDTGTPAFSTAPAVGELDVDLPPGANSTFVPTPARPPFHEYIVYEPGPPVQEGLLAVGTTETAVSDPTGYTALPGAPFV
jgi:hypothetical protein